MDKRKEECGYELATAADTDEILKLYHSQIGREFCPWTEHYPGEQEIAFDLSRNALMIKRNDAGVIVATISIDDDKAVEELSCWSEALKPGGELARLAVHIDYQNQGLAREMLSYGMEELKKRGYKSVHFMVNKYNEKALRSYAPLGFSNVGDIFMYEQPFYCYEKEL